VGANGITYRELERLLRGWGFRLERAAPAPVFRHEAQDALVALPPYRSDEPVAAFHVAAFHVAGIRRLLTERGLVEPGAFDRETQAVRTS
jgi:hypothetical protein